MSCLVFLSRLMKERLHYWKGYLVIEILIYHKVIWRSRFYRRSCIYYQFFNYEGLNVPDWRASETDGDIINNGHHAESLNSRNSDENSNNAWNHHIGTRNQLDINLATILMNRFMREVVDIGAVVGPGISTYYNEDAYTDLDGNGNDDPAP